MRLYKDFFAWHIEDLRERGWEVFRQKLGHLYEIVMEPVGGLFFGLFALFLKPFRQVVVVPIYTDRIGHLSFEPACALIQIGEILEVSKKRKLKKKSFVWLGGRKKRIANKFLADLWVRNAVEICSWPRLGITAHNRYIANLPWVRRIDAWDTKSVNKLLENPKTDLYLSEFELEQANAELRRLGVPHGSKWICLLSRDSAYLPGESWAYHSYRNSDIETYSLAAETLANLGFYVLRLGSCTERVLECENPKVIDYANSGLRSDLLDVYLPLRCHLFLSSGTGLDALALVTGRPLVLVNFNPFIGGLRLLSRYSRPTVAITKEYRRASGDPWTLSEVLQHGYWDLTRTKDYLQNDIQLQDNSPEEIRDAAIELLGLVEGTMHYSDKDQDLQSRFWQICAEAIPEFESRSLTVRVGSDFLRENPEWLR